MKIIFLQGLTGGLLRGLLGRLSKLRLNGLFTRTPVLAALLLTAVVTACGGGGGGGGGGSTIPASPKADCKFAEDNGTINCGLITLTRVFDSETTYNITVGEFGKEGTTDKIGVSNFTFTQIINGNISDPESGLVSPSNEQLTLSANATALNLNISGIANNVFGKFYLDLDLVLVNNNKTTVKVKVRYTITITAVNDAPIFDATSYDFADIPFNSTAGYSVGNVSATDPDGDTVIYSISGGTNVTNLFQISSTGEITLKKVAVNPDDYTFNVAASDNKGRDVVAEITVNVLPDYQAPMFKAIIGSESQFVAEGGTGIGLPLYKFDGVPINSVMGYSVGNVFATDANNDDIIYGISNNYRINGSSNDFVNILFTINSETGEITLNATATVSDLGQYLVNATATDDQGANTTATISVYVDNTPPVFDDREPYIFDLSLSDANAQGVVVGNVSATDEQRTLFGYSLYKDGNLFKDLFELAAADNADGTRDITLRRAATLNDFAASSITFQVVTRHQSGILLSNADITVNLNNDLGLADDFDGDGVKGLYDASPYDDTMNVTGNGELGTPYIISNIYQLQAIAGVDHAGMPLGSSDFTNNGFLYGTNAADQLTKHYELANDIDASATNTAIWRNTAVAAVGTDNFVGHGWTPIAGNSGQSFSGSFNGDGYQIRDLYMRNRIVKNSQHFALFGINSGNITSVGLINIETEIQALNNHYLRNYDNEELPSNSIHGYQGAVASLAAFNQESAIISYSYVTGLVNGSGEVVGGLVGANGGELSYSYSTAAVMGEGSTGGLVGTNFASSKQLNTYATGDVHAGAGVGNPILLPQDDTSQGGMNTQGNVGGLIGSIASASSIVRTAYVLGLATHSNAFDLRVGNIAGDRYTDSTFASLYWKDGVAPGVAVYSKYTLNSQGNGNPGAVGDQTGTNSTTTAQLQGCGLGGMVITGVMPDPTCTDLFPSADWGSNTTDGVTRGWIFNADEYPSLSAVRTSDSKQLFPLAAEQECQRNGMPLGCE